ncbi:MAG: glycosyltransferase [Actinomycetota bacterium]|nr:glycosyltransferase [Actinomycetota bacterium]
MAARAPAVVAVVVTTDPGPWFEETLQALAAQDYENFSVLVLVSGGTVDPTEVVARRLPEAFVRRLPEGCGYAAAVDEALSMVEGASFFLLCHDDCAPAPDAVHLMVEESFRSNAGIVCPKMVHWGDARVLLHVGQSADKTGAVVERVQDGEIDAGQHDAVRDVFVAPGGCTLVRGDLLRALGGYDPAIVAMGEDLDLSWRAHVAGARVVVAPAATARHLELVASGSRSAPRSDAPSLQGLQRRHELAAVLTCYSWSHLVRVVPQALLLSLGEVVVAVLVGDFQRARAVLHAWRWNVARGRELRRRRAALAAVRALGDADVRSLQVRGSARLSTYASRLTHEGIDVAHGLGARRAAAGAGGKARHDGVARTPEPASSARPGSAGDGERSGLAELDTPGRRGRWSGHAGSGGILSSGRSRLVAGLIAAVVLVFGSRGLLGVPTPLLGQFAPFSSWTALWHRFFSSWQPAGTGSHAPSSPAFGFLAIAGTALLGRSGLLQQVVVLACFPLGAWGMSRLIRPFASARARFTAAITYLALPLAVDALARGRLDGLVAYAVTPWVVLQLAGATRLDPFDASPGAPGGGARLEPSARATVPAASPPWRRSVAGRLLALGALEAVAMAFAPAMVLVVLVAGLGIAGGSLVAGGARRAARAPAFAVGGTLVAAVLCMPWVLATVLAGHGALEVLGLATNPVSSPGWGGLLRMAVGPVGGSPLGWLLLAAAVPALLVARGVRLEWAIRLWAIAIPAWLLALVAVKGWAVPFAPSVDVLLAPAAVAVAGAVGLGVAAFETDLAGHRFGWRQGVAALSIAAIAVGMLPTVAEAAGGRWGLPSSGYQSAAGFPAARRASGGYRVLWLGDPRALPSGGWSIGPGLAYATSSDGTPTFLDLWPPASAGPAQRLASGVRAAMRGETVQLGRVLEAAQVRYVVVATSLAPHVPGSGGMPAYPAPSGLMAALARQEDLRTVPMSYGGLTVFDNTAFASPARAPAVGAPRAAGSLGVLDPLGAALELCAWAAVAAALLGRRRWLDWWWRPLVGVRRRWCARRQGGVQAGPDASLRGDGGPVSDVSAVPELVGARAARDAEGPRPPGRDLPGKG